MSLIRVAAASVYTEMKGPELRRRSLEILISAVDVHRVLEDGGRVRAATLGSYDALGTGVLAPDVVLREMGGKIIE
jgi:hypothetical protein